MTLEDLCQFQECARQRAQRELSLVEARVPSHVLTCKVHLGVACVVPERECSRTDVERGERQSFERPGPWGAPLS